MPEGLTAIACIASEVMCASNLDLPLVLVTVQPRVAAVARQQHRVVTILHDPAAMHDNNPVYAADGAQAVRDDNAGAGA